MILNLKEFVNKVPGNIKIRKIGLISIITVVLIFSCTYSKVNVADISIDSNESIQLQDENVSSNYYEQKNDTYKSFDSISKQIRTFISDIAHRKDVSMDCYDKYFNQTSEIEYIMKSANKDSILLPFIMNPTYTESLTLSYILWRFSKAGIQDSIDITSIKKLNSNDSFGMTLKVVFKNKQIFYFCFNLEPDIIFPIIGNIFDKDKITLFPDNYSWYKLDI